MLPLQSLPAYSLEQISDEEFWDYARERANVVSRDSSRAEDDQDQYLELKLSSGSCLFPLNAILEVVPPPHRLARLPVIPTWMHGVAAWRGETIAVIDLDLYLSDTGILSRWHTAGSKPCRVNSWVTRSGYWADHHRSA